MDSPSLSEIIQGYFSAKVGSYADMAAMGLIIYDTLLTLEDEVALIWRKKISLGSILYLQARYCIIIGIIIEFIIDILLLVKSRNNHYPAIKYPHTALSVIALISDGAVMAITAYFAWEESKQFRKAFGSSRQSLTIILLHQGVIRFIIIALAQSIGGFDIGLEAVVSVILICRFMLQLRKFNSGVQTLPSINVVSNSGIRGRLHQVHQTIIGEFGNTGIDYDLETENGMAEVDSGDHIPSVGIDTEVCVTTEEFPWAINPVESILGSLAA
ncbi:hypothetical protein M422DRAFT_246929 [Sphaerobolus stellatus SS14]|nr:hypothetical protein M422DRAFT_246929 [Sphaerobolus stellatus SS14]